MSDAQRLDQIRERAAAALKRDPSWQLLTDDIPWMDAAINRLLAVKDQREQRIAALEAERDALRAALVEVVGCLTYDGTGDRRRYWIGSGQGAAFSAAIRAVTSVQLALAHDCGRDHPDQDVYHPPTYTAALAASAGEE